MSTDNPDDFFGPPNDNAYETDELRTGRPLDYVSEQFRHCMESLHETIHEIERGPRPRQSTTEVDQDDLLGFQARGTLFDQLSSGISL